MELNAQIQLIQEKLCTSGYNNLSELLKLCTNQNETFKLGIVGDYSTGKSSLINKLTDHNLLKTGVIPTESIFIIRKGETDGVIIDNDKIASLNLLDELIENQHCIDISCSSDFVIGKEIIEFPGLINKKSLGNMDAMRNLYMCDAAILVVSADHLLSENECLFIENYSKYVDANRLIVLINKLDLIDSEDIIRVNEFAKKQMNSRFPNIKWGFLQKELLPETKESQLGIDEIKNIINVWYSEDKKIVNENSFKNIKEYIKSLLTKDLNELKEKSCKNIELRKENAEKARQKKELEKIRLENVILEYDVKCKKTIEKIDNYLKDVFRKLEKRIISKFNEASDKYSWYKSQLPDIWKDELQSISVETDAFVLKALQDDIEWLNHQNDIYTEPNLAINDLFNMQLRNDYNGKSYGKAKKILPIGIGGSVVIGYCLFRVIGASICLGGGLLFGLFLNRLDQEQTNKIRESIYSDLEKISIESRKLTEVEIKNIQKEIKEKYNRNAIDYIEKKNVIISELDDFATKINEIEKIIEVL